MQTHYYRVSKGWVLAIDFTDSTLEEGLIRDGYKIDKKYNETLPQLSKSLERAEGIILRSRLSLDKSALKKAINLKWIGRLGSGLENIDTEYAEENGILCLSAAEGNMNALAEHTLGLLLNLSHNISRANNEIRSALWRREENIGWELNGSTVGIIGYGPMGSAFGSILKSMGVNIISYDKYLKNYAPSHVKEVDLETLQDESEIISIHLPLTKETVKNVDKNFIQRCKRLRILINTSRGKILNTADTFNSLKEKRFQALGLDVLDLEEKSLELQESILKQKKDFIDHPQVLITPHIAGWSKQSFPRMGEILLNKIREI